MANLSTPGGSPSQVERSVPLGGFEAWIAAFAGRPGNLLRNPRATSSLALTAIFLASLYALVMAVGAALDFEPSRTRTLPGLLCALPAGAVVLTLPFALYAAVTQRIAQALGGKGRGDRLTYGLGLALAPVLMIGSFVASVGLALALVPIALYALALVTLIVRDAHQLPWPHALAVALWLPLLALIVLLVLSAAAPVVIAL